MARASITLSTTADFIAPAHVRAFLAPGGAESFLRYMIGQQTPYELLVDDSVVDNDRGPKHGPHAKAMRDLVGKRDRGFEWSPAQTALAHRMGMVYQNTQMVDWYMSLPR